MAGRLVFDLPQTHDHRPGAGYLERSSQPEDAFAAPNFAHTGVTARQHGPLERP